MSRTRTLGVAAAAALAVAVLAGTTPTALAAKQAAVNVGGGGTATANTTGGMDYSGYLYGPPFNGDYTGTMTTDDGTLPALGKCEPATATLRLQADHGPRNLELVGTGKICTEWLPLGNMTRFTGRWAMTSTNFHPIAGAEGHMDFRLLNGKSDIYAAES